jgi:hypothetical protein
VREFKLGIIRFLSMSIPQQSNEQQIIVFLRQISMALESISRNIGDEMGQHKVQPIVGTQIEIIKHELDIKAEENRREEEIKELKKSNKIAERTSKFAAYGLFITAIIGILQLAFTVFQYFDKQPQEKIITTHQEATDSAKINDARIQVTTDSAKIFNK